MNQITKTDEDCKGYIPSPREVKRMQTKRGGWTRETLAKWGVPWPPPKGWRQRLREAWEWQQTYGKHL